MQHILTAVLTILLWGCGGDDLGKNPPVDRVDMDANNAADMGELPETCSDGVLNDDETDVDCGGSCSPCPEGSGCSDGNDCSSGFCDEAKICADEPLGLGQDCTSDHECASQQCQEFAGESYCTAECTDTCEGQGLACFRGLCTPVGFCGDIDGDGTDEGPGCEGSVCETCAEDATCVERESTFECVCNTGFDGDGMSCEDVNECDLELDDCDPLAGCMNEPGGFVCGQCPQGYDDVDGDGTECVEDAPQSPSLSMMPLAIKTFRFTWNDVAGETEYRLLEDINSSGSFTLVAQINANTTTHELPVFLPARVNATYVLQACNGDVCSDSAPVSVQGNLVDAIGYVKASNPGGGDQFGNAIALSGDGNTLVVGAFMEASDATGVNGDELNEDASRSGAAYVFARVGGSWVQQAYLKASNTANFARFGSAVAISSNGDTIAVGAEFESSIGTGVNGEQSGDSLENTGAVYVFTRTQQTWSQQAFIKASTASGFPMFGVSVALSSDGDTLAVGASNETSSSTSVNGSEVSAGGVYGAAYVYTRSGGTWSREAYIKPSTLDAGDFFGEHVALSGDGDTLAVSAPGEASNANGIDGNQSNNTLPDAGAVWVFTRASSVWSQQAYVKASNPDANDEFGNAISLSEDGDVLVVGAPFEGSSATGIDGNPNDNSAQRAGAVYIFSRNAGSWAHKAYVKAAVSNASDRFGFAVSLSADGQSLTIGAYSESGSTAGIGGNPNDVSRSRSGAVYLFIEDSGTWQQHAYIKASTPDLDDTFGQALDLSSDGQTLAVGARNERSSASGVGGDSTDNSVPSVGAVYLY